MAQLTKGLVVEWVADKDGSPDATWTKIPSIIKIPSLVGTPSTHDVTDIYNEMKVYIEGLADNGGTLAFGINFTPEVFAEIKKIQTAQATEDPWFRVGMPAPLSKAYQFRGTVSIPSNDEWTPDNPMQGTLNITASTDITLEEYSPG